MAKGTAVEQRPQTVILPGQLTFEEAAAQMVAEPNTMEDMIQEIVNMTDIDDILGGGGAIGLENIIGRIMTIHKAELRESTYVDGLPAFAVMHVEMEDTGERLVVTTGASKAVAQCIAMHRGGHFPQRVNSERASKPTPSGYYPITLKAAPPVEKPF